ncbi:MAG: hypothetical protein ACLFUJ_03010 [Phycisphaerae bacterium]
MPLTGYRIYRGRGGLQNVDFTTPVATSGQQAVELVGLDHPPGSSWTYVVRPVVDDLERPSADCRLQLAFDQDGQLMPPSAPRPRLLTATPGPGSIRLICAAGRLTDRRQRQTEQILAYVEASADFQAAAPAARLDLPGDGLLRAEIQVQPGTWHVALRARDADGELSEPSRPVRVLVGSEQTQVHDPLIDKVALP